MKKRRSSRRPHFRTPIIALILVVLATVGYLSYRYFFVPQVVSINKLVEEGDGLTFTQTGQRGATAPTTNNNDNKNTKEKNTKEKNTGTCSTNGSPVKAGTWAATGRYIDDKGNVCTDYKTNPNCKGACDQCKAVKGRYEFDGKDLAKCDKQVATGASVTLPSYANKSYCNGQPSCNSCFAKINGKYIQIGIGQSYQDKKGITQYCNPDGQLSTKPDEEAMKKFCPAGQKWVNGKCGVPVREEAPLTDKALCDSKGSKYTYTADGCVLVSSLKKPTNSTVSSASEYASGKANQPSKAFQNNEEFQYLESGGTYVDNVSQCASGMSSGKVKTQDGWQYICATTCEEGLNPLSPSTSYITCTNGKAVYNYCNTGTPQKEKNNSWTCPPTPTEPVTPQPPSNPNLTECFGGICPDQPIIDTPPAAPAQPATQDPKFLECMNTRSNTKTIGCRQNSLGQWEHYTYTNLDVPTNTTLTIEPPETLPTDVPTTNFDLTQLGNRAISWLVKQLKGLFSYESPQQ